MNRMLIAMLALAVLATGACASKPQKKQFQRLAGEFVSPVHITKPVDQQSAVIGITIKSPAWVPNTEDRLYLVKIENDRDLFEGSKLIPTSILAPPPGARGGGTVYVQNLPPGRYAAVAFSTSEKGFGKQWFNVKAFPTAKFVSTGVKALGGNRFEALGKMTIKGQTRDVVAPFTFKQDGNNGVFDGGFVLKRMDYNIGEGPWADVSAVANEIEIKFHVVAAPAAAAKK